jgi:ABC-type sulfate transport system permease component
MHPTAHPQNSIDSAGLASIPQRTVEAGIAIGLDHRQRLRYVILPMMWRVILPAISPALMTGCALSFARAVGEYGSVIFIAGNMPFRSEIAPLLIVVQLEQYNTAAATAIAATMLMISFVLLLAINLGQGGQRRVRGG